MAFRASASHSCPPSSESLIDESKRNAALSSVGFAVGIGGNPRYGKLDPRKAARDAGIPVGRSHGARQLGRQGIVSTGVEYENSHAGAAVEGTLNFVQCNELKTNADLVLELRAHRHEIVVAVVLHAVPGIEKQADVGAGRGSGEFGQCLQEALFVSVDTQNDFEPERLQ